MRNILIGLFIGWSVGNCFVAFGDKIPAPPPIEDSNTYHYFRQIYENLHRLEVATSNPDGTRDGKKGDLLLLQSGGSSYLEVNTDSNTTWRGVALTDTP